MAHEKAQTLIQAFDQWFGKHIVLTHLVYGKHKYGYSQKKIEAGTIGKVVSVFQTEYTNIVAKVIFNNSKIETKVNVKCLVLAE